MSDFIVFTRCDGYRFAIPYGDVFSVGDCGDGHCVIQRSSKGSDIVKGSLEEVLAMLKKPQQSNTYDHNKTAIENAHPQPVAGGLCEAVDALLSDLADAYASRDLTLSEANLFCKHEQVIKTALTAERKREKLVEAIIDDFRCLVKQREPHSEHSLGECDWCDDLYALDAFDKGAV